MNPNNPDINTNQEPEPFTPPQPSVAPEPPVTPQPPVTTPEPPVAPPAAPQTANDPGKVLAIVGLVLGFVGLSLIGLILAIIAKVKSSKAGFKNALAIVAIVINSIFLVITPILLVITLAAYSGIQNRAEDAVTESELNALQDGVLTYISEKNAIPTTLSDVATVAKLDKSVLTDSNGKAYTITWEPADCTSLFTCTAFTLTGDSVVNKDEVISLTYDATAQESTQEEDTTDPSSEQF